ncbi:MAG: hypothetical protein BWY79_00818 [Actinobacteria bacterium ADurb.Bin444]|nr:MAG: hypothetical protein BWY79_00818 [Actinobacteria bacterium ADurb.Bin444]
MRALTGVGPSMASGSQTCSGNCADLPMAPMNRSSEMAINTPLPTAPPCTASNTPPYVSWPMVSQMSITPNPKPKSPTRLVRKAFLPAAAADGLWK